MAWLGVGGPAAQTVPFLAVLYFLLGSRLGANGDSLRNGRRGGNGVTGDESVGGGRPGGGGHKRRLEVGYRHLGCFKRSPMDSEMDMQLEVLPLTLHMCYEHCLAEESSYFAVQKGSQCWCSLESSSPHFDYSSGGVGFCDAWCGGDASTTCGGWDGSSRDFYAVDSPQRAAPGLTTVEADEDSTASESTDSSSSLDRLLHLHNAARCMHATGPLTYADPVAVTAEAYADVLASEDNCGSAEASHSTLLGENVFVCASSDAEGGGGDPSCFSPESAMEAFYESQVGSGFPPTYGAQATQILWKSTSQMGCALRTCERGGLKYDILVCRYSPPAGEDRTGTEVSLEANSKSKCGYD